MKQQTSEAPTDHDENSDAYYDCYFRSMREPQPPPFETKDSGEPRRNEDEDLREYRQKSLKRTQERGDHTIRGRGKINKK